jgi:hypothetical protein
MNIPLHTGARARLLRAAIDWRSRAIRLRETLAGYRDALSHRSPVIRSTETLILKADRTTARLFAMASEGVR